MNTLQSFFLKKYDPNDKELFLKARFVLNITMVVVSILVLGIVYTSYIGGPGMATILPIEISGLVILLIAFKMLVDGKYGVAIHTFLISGFTIIWLVLFFEPFVSVVTKLDTIVFVFAFLAATPLMIFNKRKPITVVPKNWTMC